MLIVSSGKYLSLYDKIMNLYILWSAIRMSFITLHLPNLCAYICETTFISITSGQMRLILETLEENRRYQPMFHKDISVALSLEVQKAFNQATSRIYADPCRLGLQLVNSALR